MTNYYVMRKLDLVKYLKEKGLKSSFPKKADLISYIHTIQWSLNFSWRNEQFEFISKFMEESFQIIALQGLFGCGKTTMLLGILNMGYWKNKFSLDEICFCAFNVCIKNEIKRKIRSWGIKQKPMIRTFDSIIYELCEFYEYPFLKIPNYEGKRKFIYNICRKKNRKPFDKYEKIRFLFVDEAQDLEKSCFIIFQTFFKNAKMVFVGDIFQSIQKEPRESLLWWISHQEIYPFSYFYMKETPRVPENIFKDIKSSLIRFYPEYQSQIMEWRSLNNISSESIEWISYDTYKELYRDLFDFLDTHPPEKSMVLTFSSCITVKGALGDLARIRQLIEKNRPNISINANYKNLDIKSLFLSTANSSKGLERDYVFIMSTFPLEKAFINFSKDLTMNLITVAISRAKTKAIVCVPKMAERFSMAFYSYPSVPKPTYTFFPTNEIITIQQFLDLEHSVTDILRQNIIKYDTRLHFKSFIKKTIKKTCIPPNIFHNISLPKIILKTEEERAFVGICIEVLMTSTWTKKFPKTPIIADIEFNPMYAHCIHQIKQMRIQYHRLKKQSNFHHQFFSCIFLYTKLFMAINHKIFFQFNTDKINALSSYWTKVNPYISSICPSNLTTFETQKNVKMMNISGIIDGYMTMNNKKHIYEIKASVKPDWKEDAFIQAFIYAIQMGQTWFHLHLMNLFKNEYYEYVIYIHSGVIHTRNYLLHDVVIWNINSYLAKSPVHFRNLEELVFLYHSIYDNTIVMLSMSSPTRIQMEFQSTTNEDSIDFFKNYEHDHNKKYIMVSNKNNPEDDDLLLLFPFYILPPCQDLYEYFPFFKFPDVVVDTDNPVIQLICIMASLITIENFD